LKLFYTMLD